MLVHYSHTESQKLSFLILIWVLEETKPPGYQLTDARGGVNRILALVTLEPRAQLLSPSSAHFTSTHVIGSKEHWGRVERPPEWRYRRQGPS